MAKTVEEITAAMSALVDPAEKAGESMSTEDVVRYEELEGELKAVQKTAELVARQAAYKSVQTPIPGRVQATDTKDEDEVSRAFEHYMRSGQVNSDLIQRAQGEATGSAGGYLVPEGFRNKIVERMVEFGGLANAAETITTDSGQPLPWVTNDDTSNEGEIVNEGSTFASGADLVLGTKSLGAYKYMAGGASNLPLKVSVELLQDSAFSVTDFVARKLGMRLARKQSSDWMIGDGVNKPVGLLSTAGGLTTSGVTISDNAAGPTYANLIDIMHSLDPAYRAGASWIFNDSTLAKLRKVVDTTDGRPLFWDSNMNLGDPFGLRLLGFPVIIDQDAPTPLASNRFMAFGNFRETYVIRRVRDISLVTLNELYAPNGQVGFFVWARADGTVQDPNASVYVTAAA